MELKALVTLMLFAGSMADCSVQAEDGFDETSLLQVGKEVKPGSKGQVKVRKVPSSKGDEVVSMTIEDDNSKDEQIPVVPVVPAVPVEPVVPAAPVVEEVV